MSDTVKDGGPAFPTTMPALLKDGCIAQVADARGMSLRDWFAGQALIAVNQATSAGTHHPRGVDEGDITVQAAMARDAYELADALLSRKEGGQS